MFTPQMARSLPRGTQFAVRGEDYIRTSNGIFSRIVELIGSNSDSWPKVSKFLRHGLALTIDCLGT